jgi:bis(5'-nucleosidyl)-tetraphosphatase
MVILPAMRSRALKHAAGVVLFRQSPAGPHVLLLRAYRNWDLPKGRLEPGETSFEAAVREVREETGLSSLDFCWGEDFIETEPYAGGKVVRFYAARSESGDVSLPINPALGRAEHHQFRWVSPTEALSLTVPRLQRVLRWACEQAGIALRDS